MSHRPVLASWLATALLCASCNANPPVASRGPQLVAEAPAPRDSGRDAPAQTQTQASALLPAPASVPAPTLAPLPILAPAAPPAPASPAHRCGIAGLRARDLHPLDPNVFPPEQRAPTAPRAWRAPAQLAWVAPLPRGSRDSARDTVLVLLGRPEDSSCEALSVCDGVTLPAVHGPFAGVAGSDARWTAHALCGARLMLGLFDASGAPRFLRDEGSNHSGEYGWMDQGAWVEPLEAFDDGRSVVLGSYGGGDGMTDSVFRVWSVVDGSLRELDREQSHHTMGAQLRFAVTRQGERGPAPTITFTRSAGTTQETEDGHDTRVVYARPRTLRTRHYDPVSQRFQ